MARPNPWKQWREETNARLENVSPRGVAIWEGFKKDGPIGFVGGVWNGKIITIHGWPSYLNAPKERPPCVSFFPQPYDYKNDSDRYRLARINSPFGGISYCYALEEDGRTVSGWPPEIPEDAIDRVLERLVYVSTRAIKSAAWGQLRRSFELTFGNEIATGMMRSGKKSQLQEPWQ